jgi:hypothetical protein
VRFRPPQSAAKPGALRDLPELSPSPTAARSSERALMASFSRWVPDSLPLRFAPLQASGKARLTVLGAALSTLSRAHAAKRNATRDPAQDFAAKRRRTHFAEVSGRRPSRPSGQAAVAAHLFQGANAGTVVVIAQAFGFRGIGSTLVVDRAKAHRPI